MQWSDALTLASEAVCHDLTRLQSLGFPILQPQPDPAGLRLRAALPGTGLGHDGLRGARHALGGRFPHRDAAAWSTRSSTAATPPASRRWRGSRWARFFVQQLLNALRIFINNVFEQKVIFDLRSDLYAHIQRLPLGWFDNRATGDLMTRILEDVNAVERVLIDGIEQGVIAVLQIVVVVAMLLQLQRVVDACGAVAAAVSHRRRVGLHADRARPLQAAACGVVGHELPPARQPRGHPPDQDLRARGRGTPAFQRRQRPAPRGDAGHHADMGDLQSGDEFLHQRRSRAGAAVRRARGARAPDRPGRVRGRAAAGGFPLRTDPPVAQPQPTRPGGPRGGRPGVRDHRHPAGSRGRDVLHPNRAARRPRASRAT